MDDSLQIEYDQIVGLGKQQMLMHKAGEPAFVPR
jgi:hypothetical protein